jgi:hypothetical protein
MVVLMESNEKRVLCTLCVREAGPNIAHSLPAFLRTVLSRTWPDDRLLRRYLLQRCQKGSSRALDFVGR